MPVDHTPAMRSRLRHAVRNSQFAISLMRERPDKTLADYLVIAICPVLIMALVGSLAFFLLGLGYAGQFESRVRWALFWFVFGSVLVSRISIDRGSAYAGVYAVGLALAVGVFVNRFLGFMPIVWGLLAAIWWCTHKLTWDCTLIDDDEDASGEGLLQAAGLSEKPPAPSATATQDAAGSARSKRRPARLAWWERLFKNRSPDDGRAHAPGLWVVYFSLGALPLFGLGQVMIPADDAARRTHAFEFLCVYIGAALGLLLCTSFLGLRRYLRQRDLQMPPLMAGSWITLGAVLAALILLFCVLLPRPDAAYSITALAERLGAKPQDASKNAVLSGDAGEGEGRRTGTGKDGQRDEKGRVKGDGAPSEPGGKKGQVPGKGRTEGKQGKPDPGAKNSGKDKGKDSSPQSSKDGPQENPVPNVKEIEIDDSVGQWLKWILYALFGLFALWLVWRNRRQIAAVLRQLWSDLVGIWNSLLRPFRSTSTAAGVVVGPSARSRRFATFTNPFDNGDAQTKSPTELVQHTFEALQAWAGEHGVPRRPEQTPLEFARELAARAPAMGTEVEEVALHYARWAYADIAPPPECLGTLERLWQQMSESADLPLIPQRVATEVAG